MTQQSQIVITCAFAWFFVGAAVLTAIGRGPQFAVTQVARKAPSLPPIAVAIGVLLVALVWIFRCLIWPHSLYRYLRGHGAINGHLAPECTFRIQAGTDESKPHNMYRHGPECRKNQKERENAT